MLNGTEGHPAHTREEILTIIINIFYSELLREGNSIDVNLWNALAAKLILLRKLSRMVNDVQKLTKEAKKQKLFKDANGKVLQLSYYVY